MTEEEWLHKMADKEDKCPSVSAGGFMSDRAKDEPELSRALLAKRLAEAEALLARWVEGHEERRHGSPCPCKACVLARETVAFLEQPSP